jgi:hypothetical protein
VDLARPFGSAIPISLEADLNKPFLSLAYVLLVSLALAACGESQAGPSGGNESQIAETVEKGLAGHDPSTCRELKTHDYLRQETISVGEEAIEGCERNQNAAILSADAATVLKVRVNGTNATANAAIDGGYIDGQTVTVALVKQGDGWKLDRLIRFAKLDRAALINASERIYKSPTPEGPSPISRPQLDCLADVARRAPRRELEAQKLHLRPWNALFSAERRCIPDL